MKNLVISWIGGKIRSVRNDRNLSLKDLSTMSGISKGLLSKIENSRTIPSLPVFMNILEALDVPPRDFFDDMYINDGKNYRVIRQQDRKVMEKEGRKGFSYESILNQSFLQHSVDFVLLTIQPGATVESSTSDGYEFKYVMKGHLEYVIGEERIEMAEGDAIFFDARIPHYPVTLGNPATMLVVYFLFP